RPSRPVLHAGRTRMGERVRPAFFVPCRRRQARGILRGCSWIRAMLRVLLLIGLLLAGLGGSAPSATPLYRDYQVRLTTEEDTGRADTFARIRAALRSAGWEEAESEAPNVDAAAPRLISNRGLSRTDVALDVAPIGDRFVRVFFHPYRYSVLGGRTKVA